MSKQRLHPYLLMLLLMFFPAMPVLSAPYYGITLTKILVPDDPKHLSGYQALLDYDPQYFIWRKFDVYFDGGFSHFTVPHGPNSTINIYSAAPVVRYTFKKLGPAAPYIELGIGLAYLNHTRIANRNLGIHFAFQDRMGLGAIFGTHRQVSLGVNAEHYSNAHVARHNSGVTIPLVLAVSYRFR